jgi:uncharacterized protein with PQ loop repeat
MKLEMLPGIAAGICTICSLLPQLIKIYETKKSGAPRQVFWLPLAGIILWNVYGFFKEDYIIIAVNIVAFVLVINMYALSMVYSKKGMHRNIAKSPKGVRILPGNREDDITDIVPGHSMLKREHDEN